MISTLGNPVAAQMKKAMEQFAAEVGAWVAEVADKIAKGNMPKSRYGHLRAEPSAASTKRGLKQVSRALFPGTTTRDVIVTDGE